MFSALTNIPERRTAITRAKRAVACLLWMHGVPIGRIEQLITQHLPIHDAAGPVRQVANRTHDVITTVIEIADHLHPAADLTHLADLLPAQLELGIPPDLLPLATHAGNVLGRSDYVNLLNKNLTTPEAVLGAADQELMECVGGSRSRLRVLREAAEHVGSEQTVTNFADVLPAAND